MTIDELVNSALVGTARLAPTITPTGDALGIALSELQARAPDEQLLATAAIICCYSACGKIAPSSASRVEPAAKDEIPPCSRRAGELLAELLALSNAPTKQKLVMLWVNRAGSANRRVPYGLLPQLLDFGAVNRASRDAIASVIGRRGQWLMTLNPKWRFTSVEEDNPTNVWSTGNREQRTVALRRLRESDPPAARALIESTWKEDGADERASFIEVLAIGLGAADEPLLEASLSDRSKQVRAAAVSVVSKLPGSAFVRRMIERAEPILTFESGAKGGLLKRAKPDVIHVDLPTDGANPSWVRDGITEAPPHGIGKRQWLLSQIVGSIPPSEWTTRWQRTPAEIIAISAGEFSDLLLAAWARAAKQFGDAMWARALLDVFLTENRGSLEVDLIPLLAADDQQQLATRLFKQSRLEPHVLVHALDGIDFELETDAANAVASAIQQFARGRAGEYNYHVSAMIEQLAFRVPTVLYDEWSNTFSGTEWEGNRKALDQFFQTLQRRREIQREFTP